MDDFKDDLKEKATQSSRPLRGALIWGLAIAFTLFMDWLFGQWPWAGEHSVTKLSLAKFLIAGIGCLLIFAAIRSVYAGSINNLFNNSDGGRVFTRAKDPGWFWFTAAYALS